MSLMIDEVMTKPSHSLWSMLCIFFSAFTLLAKWREGNQAHKKPCATNFQSFSSRVSGRKHAVLEPWKTAVNTEVVLFWIVSQTSAPTNWLNYPVTLINNSYTVTTTTWFLPRDAAMVVHRMLSHSLCLSRVSLSQASVPSKWLKISSGKQRSMIAQGL